MTKDVIAECSQSGIIVVMSCCSQLRSQCTNTCITSPPPQLAFTIKAMAQLKEICITAIFTVAVPWNEEIQSPKWLVFECCHSLPWNRRKRRFLVNLLSIQCSVFYSILHLPASKKKSPLRFSCLSLDVRLCPASSFQHDLTNNRNFLFKFFTATEVNILFLENTFLKDKIQFYNTLSDGFAISQIPLFK